MTNDPDKTAKATTGVVVDIQTARGKDPAESDRADDPRSRDDRAPWHPSKPLPDDILFSSAEEGARKVVLRLAWKSRKAERELDNAENKDALHDFRVSVRKLRSALRAWRGELDGALGKKERRGLAKVQGSTGAGRDAEVGLEWLEKQAPHLQGGEVVGLNWLARELMKRRRGFSGETARSSRAEFDRLVSRVEERAAVVRREYNLLDHPQETTFAEVLASAAEVHVDDLAACLAQAGETGGEDDAHQARIAAKRLRYLFEPLRAVVPGSKPIIAQCKRIQRTLGNLNDANVLMREVDEAMSTASSERLARIRSHVAQGDEAAAKTESALTEWPGLLALRERLVREKRILFVAFRRDWSQDAIDRLLVDVRGVARELRRVPAR